MKSVGCIEMLEEQVSGGILIIREWVRSDQLATRDAGDLACGRSKRLSVGNTYTSALPYVLG